MTPPVIWIRLPFEGSPKVLTEDLGAADRERLLLWLRGNEPLLHLVGEAISLEAEAEA